MPILQYSSSDYIHTSEDIAGYLTAAMEDGDSRVLELAYKNITASIEFDEHDRIFTGRLLGIEDIVTFHGKSVAELEAAFHDAVTNYLEVCRKTGRQPRHKLADLLAKCNSCNPAPPLSGAGA